MGNCCGSDETTKPSQMTDPKLQTVATVNEVKNIEQAESVAGQKLTTEQEQEQLHDISKCFSKAQKKALHEGETIGHYGEQIIMLHFNENQGRSGLGKQITHAGHMAITCTDIGVSAHFYADVLGLPQIERPNFDQFGAWFTCGNVELHLIKGNAYVSPGEDLIVPHLALEVESVQACIERLSAMKPPVKFQLNVSVPRDDGTGPVKQIFLRDPDGYYIELGQTTVLTKFCLGHKKYDAFAAINSHNNGRASDEPEIKAKLKLKAFFKLGALAKRVKNRMQNRDTRRVFIMDPTTFDSATVVPDPKILVNFTQRTKKFGDIFNGKNEGDIKALLKKHNNYAPDVCLELIKAIEDNDGIQTFDPPTYYDDGQHANGGQDFEMRRANTIRGFAQKGFYKPGDEKFRFETLIEDQEKLIRRIYRQQQTVLGMKNANRWTYAIHVDDVFEGLEKCEQMQIDAMKEYRALHDKLE